MGLTAESAISTILGAVMVVLALFAIWQAAYHARRHMLGAQDITMVQMNANEAAAPVAATREEVEIQPVSQDGGE